MLNIEKAFYRIYICVILALFVWTTAIIIRFPYGVDYGEAPLMDQVRTIESGGTIYKANFNEPPYIFTNYPPLYLLITAGINFLFKIPLFQAGRLISLFFSLISGTIIGLLSWQITRNKMLGVLAAVLFWGHPYVMLWSALARVDIMALGFSLLGLWILFRRWNSNYWMGLAVLCFLASAYTRQSYILAGPLSGFVWIWYHNHRRGYVFASFFVFSGLLIFGLINLLTKGGFYNNIVLANIINQFSIPRIWISSVELLGIWPMILLTGLLAVLFTIRVQAVKWLNRQEVADQQPFIFYGLVPFSLGAFISTLTVGKVNSGTNYFLELIVVCAIWLVITLKSISSGKKALKLIFTGLLFIQLLWVFAYGFRWNRIITNVGWGQIATYDSLFQQVKEATLKGVVLSDSYMDMIVLSGQPIYYEPDLYSQLYKAGLWDITGFLQGIQEQTFPLIVIGGETLDKDNYWPVPVVASLEKNYNIEIANNSMYLTPIKYR